MLHEEAQKKCSKHAEDLRLAAQKIRLIKEITKTFDGKVYNCRFDEAIKDLSDDKNIFYVTIRYGRFEVVYTPRHSGNFITLLSGYAATKGEPEKNARQEDILFTPTKRIMADKMIERLNTKYENLLKEATQLENALTKVDEIIAKTQELKRLYNVIVSELPYEVQNNFGLQHCWR